MKTGGKNGGRRGRKHQKAPDKIEREQLRQVRAVENEKKERAQALARIIPRMKRWCKLSEIGVVCSTDKRLLHYVGTGLSRSTDKVYLSADGVATLTFDGAFVSPSNRWESVRLDKLKIIAQIRHFQVFKPKNEMLILAETIAGQHDDIY